MTNDQPIIPLFPPAWADVFGEDDFGIFAECLVKDVRFVWRWMCPGRFLMGSPKDEPGRFDAEGPAHEVTLTRGYWLGETPVTQAQWLAVMGENPSYFKTADDRWKDLPAEQVNWHQCQAFATKLNELLPGLNAALPTEAQWEYACRAGTETALYSGAMPLPKEEQVKAPALDDIAWYGGNSGQALEVSNPADSRSWLGQKEGFAQAGTHRVKLKQPNAWGLYDMLGNVWEWCADAWTSDYQNAETMNPYVRESDRAERVIRGGSWGYLARNCRAAYRNHWAPGLRSRYRGLRLAAGQNEPRAAEPQEKERSDSPERRSRARRAEG